MGLQEWSNKQVGDDKWEVTPPGKEGKWRHAMNKSVFFPDDDSAPVGVPATLKRERKPGTLGRLAKALGSFLTKARGGKAKKEPKALARSKSKKKARGEKKLLKKLGAMLKKLVALGKDAPRGAMKAVKAMMGAAKAGDQEALKDSTAELRSVVRAKKGERTQAKEGIEMKGLIQRLEEARRKRLPTAEISREVRKERELEAVYIDTADGADVDAWFFWKGKKVYGPFPTEVETEDEIVATLEAEDERIMRRRFHRR